MVRQVSFDNGERRASLAMGRAHTIQYQDLNSPLRSIRWRGDNHSRLILFGKDPSLHRYPPMGRLEPADQPQELRNFTDAVEIAWPEKDIGEEIAIDPLINFQELFPQGVPAVRSVDIGYCSIPVPWQIDDPAKAPAAWERASGLFGEEFAGGDRGFIQVIADRLDENVLKSAGVRWHAGARANIHTITPAPDRKRQFWYRLAEGIGESVSRDDEICVQSDYLFDYFVTFLGAIPISTDCEEIASIRFCGRFDVGSQGELRFKTSEVSAEMTGAEGTGTCKAVAREIRSQLEAELRHPETGLEAGLNVALARSSTLGLSRVEHMPSRLELVAVEDVRSSGQQPLRRVLETLGLCRDQPSSIIERREPLVIHINDGMEIVQ